LITEAKFGNMKTIIKRMDLERKRDKLNRKATGLWSNTFNHKVLSLIRRSKPQRKA
jgi:hypothetical protein